jgi:putative Mn2+ efflux pump MntP
VTAGFVFVTPILLGVAHAFDADHIVAVSTLVSTTRSPARALRTALGWGIGHMVPLLAIAVVGVLLGATLPAWAVSLAERAAGFVLIGLGGTVLVSMRWRGVHIHTHTHDGVRHTHFHTHDRHQHRHHHTHAAVLTGLVHGLAGSATPMLLVSLSATCRPWEALLFVAMFGLAVTVTMAAYAFGLGHLHTAAGRHSGRMALVLRGITAVACVVVGSVWIVA